MVLILENRISFLQYSLVSRDPEELLPRWRDHQETLAVCKSSFSLFIQYLALMPHLTEKLGLTPMSGAITLSESAFRPIFAPDNLPSVSETIDEEDDCLVESPLLDDIYAFTTPINDLESADIDAGAKGDEQSTSNSENNAPQGHRLNVVPAGSSDPIAPYLFRDSNRMLSSSQLKYLPLCTGPTTIRLFHAKVRLLDRTAE